MVLTAQDVDAAEALRMRLIDWVVPAAALMDMAGTVTHHVLACTPLVIQASSRRCCRAWRMRPPHACQRRRDRGCACLRWQALAQLEGRLMKLLTNSRIAWVRFDLTATRV
jgi:enoyl-CoA hydratase/carnithine racemase